MDEAITPSVVPQAQDSCGSPWTDAEPLTTDTPLLEGAKVLRRSLVPSLLAARAWNMTQAGIDASLYEVATIFLPNVNANKAGNPGSNLPSEQSTLALVTGEDLLVAKGLVEDIVAACAPRGTALVAQSFEHALFQRGTCTKYSIDERTLGYVGLISKATAKATGASPATAVAELDMQSLIEVLEEIRRSQRVSPYPAVTRDLNFILDDSIRWAQLESVCKASGGPLLQGVQYRETYRDEKKDGAGKKRVLLSLSFQSRERTLTSAEVDAAVAQIISNCQLQCGGQLLG